MPQQVCVKRTVLQLLQDQLQGVTAWQASARARELAETSRKDNRELRLDSRRRIEALRRANAAMIARSEVTTTRSLHLFEVAEPRVVIVHRQEWMREKLAAGLAQHGLSVVAEVYDGADALGISIAEQPDLVVAEDRLPSMTAVEMVRSLREFAPHTVVAAQVEDGSGVASILEAGASAVFSRRVPPAEVCEQVAQFLRDRPAEALLVT